MPSPSLREQDYAAGWARCQLPNELGQISLNPLIGPELVAGKGGKSRITMYHHGSMPGSTSCVHPVPDTRSAVIVLQNSLATNDTADLWCQTLLEALLCTPEPNDYVAVASAYTTTDLGHMDAIKEELDPKRTQGVSARSFKAYIGRYYNAIGNFGIDIFEVGKDKKLKMRWQDLELETYALQHYYDDKFTWWMPDDEVARRGRYIMDYPAEYYVLEFSPPEREDNNDEGVQMETLKWAWDPAMPHEAEPFHRR